MSEKPQGVPARSPYPPGSATPPPPAPRLYQSYLLRLWERSEEGGSRKWRASLESPSTHEQRQFVDLESLFAFLRAMTAPESAPEQEPAPHIRGAQDDSSDSGAPEQSGWSIPGSAG